MPPLPLRRSHRLEPRAGIAFAVDDDGLRMHHLVAHPRRAFGFDVFDHVRPAPVLGAVTFGHERAVVGVFVDEFDDVADFESSSRRCHFVMPVPSVWRLAVAFSSPAAR